MRRDLDVPSEYAAWLGRSVLHADADGTVEVGYEARAAFANRLGGVPGGVLAAMLDSATGLAALAALPETSVAAHEKLDVEYLRRAMPGRLIARGRVTARRDREIAVAAELVDGEGRVVARAEAVLRVIEQRPA